MIGFYNYTVILTYIGLLSSVFGMTQVIEGEYSIAFLCLLLSGVCDLFDGKIARACKKRTDQEKVFGIQIDSLCDLVCFTVFPGVISYSFGLNHGLGLISAMAIILGGVIRLGFFNVMEEERQRSTDENRKEYQGLPVTSVAIILPLLYVGKGYMSETFFPYFFQSFIILLSILFVLNIKVKKPKLKGLLVLGILAVIIIAGFVRGKL
ncbi:MAG: CDP-alcohol phosphatidyltransferase family protein [Oscillospiraceae bacterium]|nr:CDP-alcohol phosphatidyltransferase family protein [Oscillospiraceae bacterium]